MGEVVAFVSKSERERIRLIREARAHYESVFPPAGEQPDTRPAGRTAGGADAGRSDGVVS